MDGVLVNSEPLWRKAMIKGFTGSGIHFTEEDCRKTTGKRIGEVVSFWHNHHKIKGISTDRLERNIMDELLHLIDLEGAPIEGIPELLDFCDRNRLKTGVATSSSNELMQRVLKKLNFQEKFNSTISAEHLRYGKPHPEVFLMCADALELNPASCIVIEDSINGVIAAKAAHMHTIAVPDEEHREQKGFAIADSICTNMNEAQAVVETLVI
jgi:sugar-phosphatase